MRIHFSGNTRQQNSQRLNRASFLSRRQSIKPLKAIKQFVARQVIRKVELRNGTGQYALATGEAAIHRLELLQQTYGPGTLRLLELAGVRRGMRVADFGCGIGSVTSVLSGLVGPEGSVVGIDYSGEQIAQAKKRTSINCGNLSFMQASATDTRLPSAWFDVVYSRFLLIHLPEPALALAEMQRLLKPNGILICEDGDLTTAGSEPSTALDAFAELFGKLGPARGVDYTLGRRLFQMVLAVGFGSPEIRFNQPVVARGPTKRLLELSVAEASAALVDAGLVTAAVIEETLLEMRRVAAYESVLALMPRMTQIWARAAAAR